MLLMHWQNLYLISTRDGDPLPASGGKRVGAPRRVGEQRGVCVANHAPFDAAAGTASVFPLR